MARRTLLRPIAVAVAVVGLSGAALAESEEEKKFSLSGFASLVGGKVLSGERHTPSRGWPCPCFIADYGHGTMYGSSWQVKQESKLGVQGTYAFTPSLSATAQVVGRGVDGVKAGLEWAYLSYDLDSSWTVQLGRKRLPIYYYSDFQDVGYAYTWVRPTPDVYGWEIINYNGVNATYRGDWGSWAVKSNVFGGKEETKKNLSQRIYYDTLQDVTWKNIIGGDLVFTRDWLTTRLTYIQSGVQQWDHDTGERVTPDPSLNKDSNKQTIYGISANVDFDRWLLRSEYSVFDRTPYSYKVRATMLGGGWRQGKYTTMYTRSRYVETYPFESGNAQRDHGWSMTLRYEFAKSSAFKVQYDRFRDSSDPGLDFVGHSRLLSFSIDTVF